ncbi:hypothetical protein D7V64_05140 [Acinetobacter cumulans]|uniref:DcaP-like protein n=2 Tax=Acinetobacter cumulans TaxID=2136182 RepID=A0A3A8G6Y5_9GAMM|nr:hypothetical protein D7V64_05140 [Acinetobacter cumulans]
MNQKMLSFKLNRLVIACACSFPIMSFAASTTDAEIQQLRDEVKALKLLMQQYAQQQQSNQQSLQQIQASTAKINTENTPALKVEGTRLKTKAGAELTFYGNVRADASYQAEGGSAARLYNQINTVPLTGNNESSDRLKASLGATRLGLDFKTATSGKDINAKLEVDFLGSNDALRIRHAYMNYGNWLIGQTWSNFAVPDYMPETIDALGYVGGAVKRTPQVRYSHKFSPITNVVLAAEDAKDESSNMRLPALTARLNHQLNERVQLGARAMGSEKKTDTDAEMTWGVGLGAKWDVTEKTMIKADYYHVKGDSSFVSWSNQGFVTNANKDIIARNEFDSITLGITQQFSPQLRGTLGYGYMKADQNDVYINALTDKTKANKDLWQAWANLFYNPIKPISLGLEYVYGEREAFAPAPNGSQTGTDNRVNAVAMYNF